MENWKSVINYNTLYEVSDLGNVRSIDKTIIRSDGFKKSFKGRVLKLSIDGTGYYTVKLSNNGLSKTHKVHILVAESFLNHRRCGYKLVVDHKDQNSLNNKLENLQVITHKENIIKGYKTKKATLKSGFTKS